MTTKTRYFRKPLALLMLAALGASMMILLASRAQAANFVVTNTNDSGAGSLRDAIEQANASTGVVDTISFQVGLSGTIPLASTLDVTDSAGLTIDGGSTNITISGGGSVRVFSVASGANLNLSNLTVANGFTGNFGGGIFNDGGTLEVNNSTLSSNSATFGGGIFNDGGTLEVNNSTLSSNSATFGGGILADEGTKLTVTNSTFSGNSATLGGGITSSNASTITLRNTILANSTCSTSGSGTFTDDGGNLDEGATCGLTASSSKSQTPAGLDPSGLQNNGGPTNTIALQASSAAIDAAVECPPPTTDQRGVSRPQASACDIGAFELQSQPALSINDITLTEGNSGTTTATFTVSLSNASGQTVSVNYSTADGTATAGTDYQSTSATLTFAPGQTTQTVRVQVNGDTVSEDDETFFVNLGSAANGTISDAQGIGTITNDDPPPNLPTTKAQCKNGGYKDFGFKNQGQCIKAVKQAS